MNSLGPLTYRRARYRSGAIGSSPVPVDESLGLVDDYLTRLAAQLGLLIVGLRVWSAVGYVPSLGTPNSTTESEP